MALKSDRRTRRRAERIAATLRTPDARALRRAGITPAEVDRLQREIRGKVVVPGMPEYGRARSGNPVYPHVFAPKVVKTRARF